MIIWLASYPKSGNTWVRLFLNSLFFTKSGEIDINDIKIGQFPERKYFNNLVNDMNDFNEISRNWIISQQIINLDKKIKFFKTHHAYCKINNNYFTNSENTKAVIYIVRDPRNVITSLLNHFDRKDYHDALEFLLEENRIIGKDQFNKVIHGAEMINLIGSWKNNYNSWKNFPKNLHIIKYEDLVKDPTDEFNKLCDFLSNLLKIKFDKDRVNQSIVSTSFNNLKNQEKNMGFKEAVVSEKSGKKIDFFNLGPNNDWNKILNKEIREKIEKSFNKEMLELGYLKK
tara:strand:+ start:69 stop:923 length:855 start_codon:yes stop_codon:yes gene_type:complete